MTTIRPTSFSMTDLRVLAKIKALGLGRLSGFDWAVLGKIYTEGIKWISCNAERELEANPRCLD